MAQCGGGERLRGAEADKRREPRRSGSFEVTGSTKEET